MSRTILVFGHSGVGKSYSIKNLDPNTTFVIDADQKNLLPFAGAKTRYKKNNFYSTDSLDKIQDAVLAMNTEKFAHIKVLVIDGITNVLASYLVTYDEIHKAKNNFEKYQKLYEKAFRLFKSFKEQRDDLTIVVIGHVELGDQYQPNSNDKLKVPGQAFKNSDPDGGFAYTFYAKCVGGDRFFETQANHSTAKSPEGCLPEIIPNDLAAAIEAIELFENGEPEEK